jgi:hypothetical protein
MLRRTAALEALEAHLRSTPVHYPRNVRIFDMLWAEARDLGAIPRQPSLRGLDHDIRYAAAINRVATARRRRP